MIPSFFQLRRRSKLQIKAERLRLPRSHQRPVAFITPAFCHAGDSNLICLNPFTFWEEHHANDITNPTPPVVS